MKLSLLPLVTSIAFTLSTATLVNAQDTNAQQRYEPTEMKAVLDALDASPVTTVFIELELPSVVEMAMKIKESDGTMPTAEKQRIHAAKITEEHNQMLTLLKAFGAEIVSTSRVSMNGITVIVDKQFVDDLSALEGVKAVRTKGILLRSQSIDISGFRDENIQPYEFLGGEALHELGFTGKGVTIAIVDEGVNYRFQGLGGDLVYRRRGEPGDNPNIIEEGTFPTEKVIGGIDLAGANFSVENGIPPSPDPDPIEPNPTHGTVSAALAAADFGFDFNPGFAPDAKILAVKVFSDTGNSTNLLADGIEYALDPNQDGSFDDRADVINISAGSSFSLPSSASTLAAQAAVDLGVVLVASAGNDPNVPFTVNSPSIAPGAISVGSSTTINDAEILNFTISSNNLNRRFPTYTPNDQGFSSNSLEGELFLLPEFTSCEAISEDLSNKIAVMSSACLDTPRLFFTTQLESIIDANAVGVLIVTQSSIPLDPSFFFTRRFQNIAALTVSNYHGGIIMDELRQGQSLQLSIDITEGFEDTFFRDIPSLASSAGPTPDNLAFKPDITAPADDVSVLGNEDSFTGTSFASPTISGIAAALLEKHPAASPADIKSMILNTSTQMQTISEPGAPLASVTVQGVGRAQADAAGKAQAYTSEAALSLGFINPSSREFVRRELTVTNTSDANKLFNVSVEENATVDGLRFRLPNRFVVPANSSRRFTFRFTVDPARIENASPEQSNIEGWLRLESAEETLSVGYFGVIEAASDVSVKTIGSKQTLINPSRVATQATRFTDYPLFAVEASETELNQIPQRVGASIVNDEEQQRLDIFFHYPDVRSLPFFRNRALNVVFFLDFGDQTIVGEYLIGDAGRRRGADFNNIPFIEDFTFFDEEPLIGAPKLYAPSNSNLLTLSIPLIQPVEEDALFFLEAFSEDFEVFFAGDEVDLPVDLQSQARKLGGSSITPVRPLEDNEFWLFLENTNDTNVVTPNDINN